MDLYAVITLHDTIQDSLQQFRRAPLFIVPILRLTVRLYYDIYKQMKDWKRNGL